MSDLPPAARAPLLALGFIALALGVAGGLVRLGLSVPAAPSGIAWHGVLMASAFFGTLIALERAVAVGRLWAYAAPAASGAGGVVLLSGAPQTGFSLMLLGSAEFLLATAGIWVRHRALHTGLLALGAFGLLAANLEVLAGWPAETAVPSWIAFLTLTIGGERLELTRLTPVPRGARAAFAGICAALLLSALAVPALFQTGVRTGGILLLVIAMWLARYDIAARTARAAGLTRYIALCLLAGYGWLALGGALLAMGNAPDNGRALWDAALHSIFLGFVFSMVFAHAPVIFPAVLRVAIPYSPMLYLPVVLLHVSLLLRIAGDMSAGDALRQAGGGGNAVAIAVFIVTAAVLALTRGRARR